MVAGGKCFFSGSGELVEVEVACTESFTPKTFPSSILAVLVALVPQTYIEHSGRHIRQLDGLTRQGRGLHLRERCSGLVECMVLW